MMTEQELLLKAEHDAWLSNYKAEQMQAIQDYNIMMGVLDDPSEDLEMEGEFEE